MNNNSNNSIKDVKISGNSIKNKRKSLKQREEGQQ